MSEMNERDWKLAYELARSLEGREIGAIEKLQVYLRSRKDVEGCKEMLAAFETNADRYLGMNPNQRTAHGVSFIRTPRMAENYQSLSTPLNRLFGSGRDVEKQACILGWVARLLKYARAGGNLEELSARNNAVGTQTPVSPSGIGSLSERDKHAKSGSTQNVKPPKQAPAPPRLETKREIVTLLTVVKNGKAQVRTEQGEEINCATLPAYPKAEAGETFRAEITRENGKAIKCVFKAWS
jgi:hypothetical protein